MAPFLHEAGGGVDLNLQRRRHPIIIQETLL